MIWAITGLVACVLAYVAYRSAQAGAKAERYSESLSKFQRDHEWAVSTKACEALILNDLQGQALYDYMAHVDECSRCAKALDAPILFVEGIGKQGGKL